MIQVYDNDLEQALAVFTEKSKGKLKEAAKHSYFRPETHKRSRKGKTNSKNNQKNRKR